MSQIANLKLSRATALGGLSVNLNHLKRHTDDNMSIDEHTSDEETLPLNPNQTNNITYLKNIFPIKLKYNKIIKLCRRRKVIQFVNYKYKIDPENYCREKLLLYIPWQQNELKILETYKTYIDAYSHFQKQIHEKMKIYEPAAQIIEHALLDYNENPEKFIPNSHPTIEEHQQYSSRFRY